MKKISKATIERINQLSPDELVAHGIIQHARVSGFVCPICGSGEGSHGTGIEHNKKIETHTSFTCRAGKHSFNVLRLCALHYGLDTRNDYPALVEKICADFDIALEYEDFTLTNGKRTAKKKRKRREPITPEELKNIQADLNAPIEPLIRFVDNKPDKKWRGFDSDFLLAHGCRIINAWTHPKNRGTNHQELTPTWRMILPVGEDSYLARLIDSYRHYDTKAQPYIKGKEKLHVGHKKLFNPDALQASEPIFCFEGYFDAMSAESVGFQSVALGGCGEGDLLLDAIDKLNTKPPIIILFDNDKAGQQAAESLRADLLAAKCPCVFRFLSEPKKDYAPTECISGNMVLVEKKIDANEILQKFGFDVLRIMLQSILDDSLAELNAVEAELAKKDECGLSDEDWDFIFSGDSTDLAFARRLERFCGSNIRWLSDDERWLLHGDGLWQLYSEKNSCITPFARRLADAMIQNADNKDERDLADQLQSAKKIGSAIFWLKGLDSIIITADDLDKHPELLNAKNGVINLEDSKLMNAEPKLYLTQQLSVAYDPCADSTFAETFFTQIQPDEMTRCGLLRWLGYCLTGESSAEKFAVWTGASGANGKGTLSGTLLELLGSYATGLAPRSLLRKYDNDADKATTALNSLEKARFAISEEMPLDGELDCSLIKNLTGGDRINLRRNYGEFRTIRNYAKINLSGNFAPKIENVHDGGILRRMINFAFNVQFGTNEHPADPDLKKKLLLPENLRGLLALLVREAANWFKEGLIISPLMKQATEHHLSQNDFIADFISDNYVFVQSASVKAKDFLEHLKQEYPRECNRFKRNDLIQLIANVNGVTYGEGRGHMRVFKGIGKAVDDFNGTPINPDDLHFEP